MRRDAWNDFANLRIKTVELCKVSTLCFDDHHFKKKESETVGELSNVCSRIVVKCLYLTVVGRQTCSNNHKMEESL